MRVRDEISKYSALEDRAILLWLLDKYPMESQWRFVASCTHRRYGPYSFQVDRVWAPTQEGRILYAARESLENTPWSTTKQKNGGA